MNGGRGFQTAPNEKTCIKAAELFFSTVIFKQTAFPFSRVVGGYKIKTATYLPYQD